MSSKRFLALFGAGFLTVAGVVVSLNMYLDVYGLFRPARGRYIGIYGEERVAKYLHSFRYIPENFDGVLLGSSVSDNLDTRNFPEYRLYNASIDGGNVADLLPIAENVFRKRELKLTIVCIHRYLTNDHALKTDFMSSREYWGALASPQLFTSYVSRLAIRSGIVTGFYDDFGTRRLEANIDVKTVHQNVNAAVVDIRRGIARVGDYHIDPLALTQLASMLAIARNRSQLLVVFYPPTPAPILAACAGEIATYNKTINGLLRPDDILIDFNAPQYASIRDDYHNFVDAVHLSNSGANRVLVDLGRAIASAEQARRTGSPTLPTATSSREIGSTMVGDEAPRLEHGRYSRSTRPLYGNGAEKASVWPLRQSSPKKKS